MMGWTELLKWAGRAVQVRAHARRVGPQTTRVRAHSRTLPGPYGREVKPIPTVQRQIWEFGVHEHAARRSGHHFDLRLGDPAGDAHSWFTVGADSHRKTLPGPGESARLRQTFTHRRDYMDFEGTLSGFGAGDVLLYDRGRALIHHADDRKILFSVIRRRRTDDYALIRVGGPNWRLHNLSDPRPARPRPRYAEQAWQEDVARDPDTVLSPKLDGAHTEIRLTPRQRLRAFSLRPEKDGGPIEYTHKLDALWQQKSREPGETILRGETVAVDARGRILPAERTAGLLNMGLEEFLRVRDREGVRLVPYLFDVDTYRGEDAASLPLAEKYRILDHLADRYGLDMAPHVQQRAAKRALLRQIGAGRHPLTREGVIIRRESALPIKMKPRAEYDVWVRSVFPGQGRLQGTAGGFRFAWTPRGPVAGRVGTGFSVAQRRELLRQAGRFRGRAARVTAQQRYPSGALRGAAFAGWHVEKNER